MKTLRKYADQDVLWLNGDEIFDCRILEKKLRPIKGRMADFVCVNHEKVGEEEVNQTIGTGHIIKELSKSVQNGP